MFQRSIAQRWLARKVRLAPIQRDVWAGPPCLRPCSEYGILQAREGYLNLGRRKSQLWDKIGPAATVETAMAKTNRKNKKMALLAKVAAARSKKGFKFIFGWEDKAKRTKLERSGAAALGKWGEEQERKKLADLEWGEEPAEPGWDIKRPWWIAAMPLVIMAIPRDADAVPDWSAIAERATEIIEQAAAKQESSTKVSMRFLRKRGNPEDGHGATTCAAWSDGRMARAHCSYDISGLFESLEGPYKKAFSAPNPRRVKRRQGKRAPAKWTRALGSQAEAIWAAGIAPKWPIAPGFHTTVEEAKAWIQALEERGAVKARLCPNFYEAHREDLELLKDNSMQEAQKAWESLERGMGDHLRQKWALAEAMGGAGEPALPCAQSEDSASSKRKPRI